jgi:hypothetical protein
MAMLDYFFQVFFGKINAVDLPRARLGLTSNYTLSGERLVEGRLNPYRRPDLYHILPHAFSGNRPNSDSHSGNSASERHSSLTVNPTLSRSETADSSEDGTDYTIKFTLVHITFPSGKPSKAVPNAGRP